MPLGLIFGRVGELHPENKTSADDEVLAQINQYSGETSENRGNGPNYALFIFGLIRLIGPTGPCGLNLNHGVASLWFQPACPMAHIRSTPLWPAHHRQLQRPVLCHRVALPHASLRHNFHRRLPLEDEPDARPHHVCSVLSVLSPQRLAGGPRPHLPHFHLSRGRARHHQPRSSASRMDECMYVALDHRATPRVERLTSHGRKM